MIMENLTIHNKSQKQFNISEVSSTPHVLNQNSEVESEQLNMVNLLQWTEMEVSKKLTI